MSKKLRPHRRPRPAHHGDTIEFAEFLDPIAAPAMTDPSPANPVIVDRTAADPAESLVETVGDTVEPADLAEPADEPIVETVGDPIADTVDHLIVEDLPPISTEADEAPTQPEPENPRPEASSVQVVEPFPESRFADSGVDDDRLPLPEPKRRWPRH